MAVSLHCEFAEAVSQTRAALALEGFGVPVEIDIAANLATKLGVRRRPYLMLGACAPELADRALRLDPSLGLLLPCNVVIREEPQGSVTVEAIDPMVLMSVSPAEGLADLATEVAARLRTAVTHLAGLALTPDGGHLVSEDVRHGKTASRVQS